MGISKRLLMKIVLIFLVGSVAVYGFVQYISLTNRVQYSYKGPVTGERIEIQSVSANATTSTIILYAQSSTASGPVILDCAVIKDSLGDSLEVIQEQNIEDNNANTAVDAPRVDADWTKLDIAVTPGTLIAGEYYTLTLVSKIGNSFVSPSFKPTV